MCKINTKIFKKRAIEKHNDKYDYSKVEYITSRTKVIIICKEHGEFRQRASAHLLGAGCPECGLLKRAKTQALTMEQFIEKAIKVHGNRYDYSLINYTNRYNKIEIICKKHGKFNQSSGHHLSGQGCPKCGGKIKLNTEEFKKRAIEKHGNRYDYLKVKYINAKIKVEIICKKHGTFFQIPGNHIFGQGCPKCSNSYKKSTEEFIKQIKEIFADKYNYSKVKYKNEKTKVIIICPIHGEFEELPNSFIKGNGCPKCKKNNKCIKFIKQFNKKHDNKYDYSKVKNIDSKGKITIICPYHGPFKIYPYDHLYGRGCSMCSNNALTQEEFIEECKKIHNGKYDYSKVKYHYKKDIIIIICFKHGEFKQNAFIHLNGSGCKLCNIENSSLGNSGFIKKSIKMHGNKYDYSKIEYKNASSKIIIICPIHGEFVQTAFDHARGSGCPKCSRIVSKAENEWLDEMGVLKNHRQKSIKVNNKWFKVDGCKDNIIYEFYGDFWHGNPKIYNKNDINPISKKTYGELYNNTIKRENILKNAGYKLVVIWENEWRKK